jgi:hypothetical protein
MRNAIEKLRKALPELLTLRQYCDATGRCEASAYKDLRRKPGLSVKVGYYTRFAGDVMLDGATAAAMGSAERSPSQEINATVETANCRGATQA